MKKKYILKISEFIFSIFFDMQNRKIKFKSAFTLVEITLVCVILGLILPSMITLYTFITTSNREIGARQDAIQQGYEIFERLNVMLEDYTIDYEEYYNRQMVGCVGDDNRGENFTRNVGLSGYCTNFTAYGNYNSAGRYGVDPENYDVYYCSNDINANIKGNQYTHAVRSYKICGRERTNGGRQSFGQYKKLFYDVGKKTGNNSDRVGDSDDRDMGTTLYDGEMINAIMDPENVQELYFISHDGKSRLFFRRALVNTGENGEAQYKIQMLKLRGFDAGHKHDFDQDNSEGIYDGQIDTWVCDAGMGFICTGESIGEPWGGVGYNLPANVDDGWVDLTQGGSNIIAWKANISPTTDSELAWAKEDRQINAYIKLLIVSGIYPPYYAGRMSSNAKDFQVPLETMINMKDFYRN